MDNTNLTEIASTAYKVLDSNSDVDVIIYALVINQGKDIKQLSSQMGFTQEAIEARVDKIISDLKRNL